MNEDKIAETIKQKIMCEVCHSRVATKRKKWYGKSVVKVCSMCYKIVKF